MAEATTVVGDVDLASASDAESEQLERELNGGDTTTKVDNHDDDDDGDERTTKTDTELDDAADETERDAIKERRRQERLRRKHNRIEKVETLERTVESLAAQNRKMAEDLTRLTQSDSSAKLNQLDGAIQEADQVFNHYKAIMADATAKADGTTAAQAMDLMLKARDRHTQLVGVKQSMVQASKQPAPVNPMVRRAATEFAAKNKWYQGPGSTDSDSQVMTMLDNAVTKDGFDPSSETYWQELESRAKKYLPHRFNVATGKSGDYNGTTERRPRSPVAGAGQRESRSSESEGGFKLSTERVKAMKEAGIWDDPTRRQKMIAQYRKIDREST
jgi:hypothetical protein